MIGLERKGGSLPALRRFLLFCALHKEGPAWPWLAEGRGRLMERGGLRFKVHKLRRDKNQKLRLGVGVGFFPEQKA